MNIVQRLVFLFPEKTFISVRLIRKFVKPEVRETETHVLKRAVTMVTDCLPSPARWTQDLQSVFFF